LAFLFTEIHESTRLGEYDQASVRAARARHDRILETVVEQHDGVLVDPRGKDDGRFVVFRSSAAALRAATDLQRALQREDWPLPVPLRVRMALHTGEADVRDGDYYGAPTRCAGIGALAHASQVLVSATTAAIVRDDLPEDISLRELGTFRLKDFTRPELIFQLLHPELPAEFPALRSAEASTRPVQDTEWLRFRERVHSALVRLSDPPALETHPLAAIAHSAEGSSSGHTAGRTLRESLLAAIGAIGNDANRRAGASRAARLARHRYVDGESIERIRDELGIGRSEYFREHARALDAITAVLRARWIQTLESSPSGPARGSVPRELTSFVGRHRESAEVLDLMGRSPLVTLTGSGGVGKTRLALAVSRVINEGATRAGPRAVWFVELSGLPPDSAVDRVVAASLGLRETPGEGPTDSLSGFLAGEPKVLVLDNCEHVADQCARLVTRLLVRCPNLKVLTTSREPLRVAGEAPYRVPPLAFPDPEAGSDPNCLSACEAVQLFVARSQVVLPGFRLVDQNATAVAEICRRLEGVPLAVELAAARTRGLSVGQIVARLDDSLRLLTGGDRGGSERHESIRAAIEWSVTLLRDSERRLFQRLSVFAGGWSLRAAEALSGADEGVLADLLSLVDKSLVVADGGSTGPERYHLLEIVRQYARYQLESSGEVVEIEHRHAKYFAEVAEAASKMGADEDESLDQVDLEIDNARAALRWSTEHDVDLGMAIAAALWRYWYLRGSLAEGRNWLEKLLERAEPVGSRTRGAALFAAAQLALIQGGSTPSSTRPLAEESLAIRAALGDRMGAGWSTHLLAHCAPDSTTEHALLTDAASILRETSDDFGLAWTLHCLANAVDRNGTEGDSRSLQNESLRFFKRTGNRWGIAHGLVGMGNAAAARREFATAREFYEQGLALQRETKTGYLGDTLNALGRAEAATGRPDHAIERFRESLEHARIHGARWEGAYSLEGLADVALSSGLAAAAVRLLAAAQSIRTQIAAELSPGEQATFEGLVNTSKASLGPASFTTQWETGLALTWEQALNEGVSLTLLR
jgi:predicted ATPase